MQRARINHAAAAYCHAVLTQKIQIAADLIVPDRVYCTVDIDMAVDKVDQIISLVTVGLVAEIHIGDLIGVQIEFLKNIDACTVNDLLGFDVDDAAVACNLGKISTRKDLRRSSQRIGKNAHSRNSRNDPPCQMRLFFCYDFGLFVFQFFVAPPDLSLLTHCPAPS